MMLESRSRQTKHWAEAPENAIYESAQKDEGTRETGKDNPAVDFTLLTGTETAMGPVEFDSEGPISDIESPMPLEHTSADR